MGGMRALTSRGYTVHEASSGVEALKLWKEHSEEDYLLFTDVDMPDGVSGPQLAAELRSKAPGLNVLFTSGYSEKALASDLRLAPDVDSLQKPYPPERRATAIRGALQSAAGS